MSNPEESIVGLQPSHNHVIYGMKGLKVPAFESGSNLVVLLLVGGDDPLQKS